MLLIAADSVGLVRLCTCFYVSPLAAGGLRGKEEGRGGTSAVTSCYDIGTPSKIVEDVDGLDTLFIPS